MGLISIGATGLPFTWCNKSMNNEATIEQLDQALSNYQRLKIYPTATLQNLPILGLDHASIILKTGYISAYTKQLLLNLK